MASKKFTGKRPRRRHIGAQSSSPLDVAKRSKLRSSVKRLNTHAGRKATIRGLNTRPAGDYTVAQSYDGATSVSIG